MGLPPTTAFTQISLKSGDCLCPHRSNYDKSEQAIFLYGKHIKNVKHFLW